MLEEKDLSYFITISLLNISEDYSLRSLILNNFVVQVFDDVYEPIITIFNNNTKKFNLKNGIMHGNNLESAAILGGFVFRSIISFILDEF